VETDYTTLSSVKLDGRETTRRRTRHEQYTATAQVTSHGKIRGSEGGHVFSDAYKPAVRNNITNSNQTSSSAVADKPAASRQTAKF